MNTDDLLLLVLIFVPVGLIATIFVYRNAKQKYTTTFRIIQRSIGEFAIEQKVELRFFNFKLKSYYVRHNNTYGTFERASEVMEQRRKYTQTEIDKEKVTETVVYSDGKNTDYPKYK